MKKTLNINLAGYPFTIDDDAYKLLKDYLDTIRYAFETQDDTEDLASDIETRIAEILMENEGDNFKIVTLQEITAVIERIGKPSEFIELEETIQVEEEPGVVDTSCEETENTDKPTPPPYESSRLSRNPFVRKRIFRDPQNAMLGGVCAGLAQYLHIDVTIIRLMTVLLFFLSASTVAIVYIILWIVVPEARTPLQRMQMMGEDATVENIGKTVTGVFQENNTSTTLQPKTGFGGFLSTILSIFIKILIFLGLLIAIPLLIALSAGLIGCIIAVFVIGVAIASGISDGAYGWFNSTLEGQFVFFILLAVIGGIITVGIPVWLLFRMLWKKKDNSSINSYNPNNQRILLISWLCGIALLSVFTVKAVKKHHDIDIQEWGANMERISELNHLDIDDIENVNIKKGGITIKSKNGKKYEIANGRVTIDNELEEKIVTDKDTVAGAQKEVIINTDTLLLEKVVKENVKEVNKDSIK